MDLGIGEPVCGVPIPTSIFCSSEERKPLIIEITRVAVSVLVTYRQSPG